jgi:hypothetical protein
VLAILLIGTKVPLGQLSAESAAAGKYSSQLDRLRAENGALASQIRQLGTDSEIASLAHADYGLIHPGQEALVILPSSQVGSAGPDPLGTNTIRPSQVVPSDANSGPPVTGSGDSSSGSLFDQVVQRLEFWRWAF